MKGIKTVHKPFVGNILQLPIPYCLGVKWGDVLVDIPLNKLL